MRTLLSLLLLAAFQAVAIADIRVVTSTPTYADIVRQIGRDHVRVQSIMRGPESSHNVIPKPSHIMKLRKAKLFIHSGLDGEPWVPQLVKGARKPHLLPGRNGNIDVSRGIPLKQVPKPGDLSRAQGDIHVYGNPHYTLDPLNGVIIARTIAHALKRADPGNAETYERNLEAYSDRLRSLAEALEKKMAPYRGARVVTYHRTWPYFLDRFGLVKIAEVEPKPGISPGPQHLHDCIEQMKARQAKIVIVETFNPKKNADFVAKQAHGKSVVLAHEVHALPGCNSYEDFLERNVNALLAAFQEIGLKPNSPDRLDSGQNGNPIIAGDDGVASRNASSRP